MKLSANWNKHMQCNPAILDSTSFPLTQTLPVSLLVIESPAPTLAPCIPMGTDGVKVWLDYLFVAIFDCSAFISTQFKFP